MPGNGWIGIGPEEGTFIPDENALQYAKERLEWDQELQKDFVEWFYSGNYIRVEQEEMLCRQ